MIGRRKELWLFTLSNCSVVVFLPTYSFKDSGLKSSFQCALTRKHCEHVLITSKNRKKNCFVRIYCSTSYLLANTILIIYILCSVMSCDWHELWKVCFQCWMTLGFLYCKPIILHFRFPYSFWMSLGRLLSVRKMERNLMISTIFTSKDQRVKIR